LTPDTVRSVKVRLPTDGAGIVDNSAMPDVNLQYIVAVALIDGTVSFADSHSQARMRDPRVTAVKSRVELIADRALVVPEAPRSAIVEITRADGSVVTHFTKYAPGTKENPLTTDAVNGKARDLMSPVLGAQRTEAIIQRIHGLESVANMRELRTLLTG
jgi:2-methylcitrate dehydratase PrpD